MASVVWNDKTRAYASKLLSLAEANGIRCTCVFLDDNPYLIEADRRKMPLHFRSKFRTYQRGIAEILIARGSIRHEKSDGAWAKKISAASSPPRYPKVIDPRFDIPKFSAVEPAVKLGIIAAKNLKEFLEHATATGVILSVVCRPGQAARLIGTGANSKAHSAGFYVRLEAEGPAIAALLLARPHPDVQIITTKEI
jgi:hypothetical protein